ncbi:MAG: 50S ribosomal protein L17 [Bacilli bacterium]
MGYRKLGRSSAHRKSMLRNLATDVITNDSIETTFHRAKETQRLVDKLVTLGKKGDLASRRKAASILMNVDIKSEDKTALQRLFDDVAPRYKERQGGYTRIIKLDNRRGDDAEVVILELV